MKRLFLIITLLFVSVQTRAEAGADNLQALPVVLKEKASVSDKYIRLGDLFSGLSDEADKKTVAPAPALGKEAVLTAEWLKKLAQTNNIAWEPTGKNVSITVKREASEISKRDVAAVILKELKEQGVPEEAEILFQKSDFPVLIPLRAVWTLTPVQIDYSVARSQFEAKLSLNVNDEETEKMLKFNGKIRFPVFTPVVAQDLKAGQLITDPDIIVRKTFKDSPVRSAPSVTKEELIGKELKKNIRAGQLITLNDVRAQVMVTKGKIVTLSFTKGGIMLSAQGKALENGGLGDTVRVMNLQSKSVVQGTVSGPETVSIHTSGKKP